MVEYTIKRLGAFFFSRIAVEKSFLSSLGGLEPVGLRKLGRDYGFRYCLSIILLKLCYIRK